MLLPKEDIEERAIGIFLEYYNQAYGTSYDIDECEWLDICPKVSRIRRYTTCGRSLNEIWAVA